MNPDQLFDYLDGKLSPADRTALEEKLMSDAHLRQQFQIAREIHRSGRKRGELILPSDDPATVERGGRLGRRIATAAIALVFLNVFVGLAVITVKNKKKAPDSKESEIRRQLSASLGAAAQNAMPPPKFAAAEVEIIAPRAEWEAIANRIIAGATDFGGSAVRGIPDENTMTVVADVPSNREAEFRRSVSSAATIAPMPAIEPGASAGANQPNERTIIQVRIIEAAR